MEKNEGTVDRIVRIVLGLIILYGGASQVLITGVVTYLIALLGLILIVTGATGYCALYTIIGFNTLKTKIE